MGYFVTAQVCGFVSLLLLEQASCTHEDAGCTKTTLNRATLVKSIL